MLLLLLIIEVVFVERSLAASSSASSPHIVTVIADDLGWYDTQVNNPKSPTPTLATLAREGLVLDRHYAYRYCSPTRRSFLTGRLPTSLSTAQPEICSSFLPLDAPLISEVLTGYVSHFIGKGHLGYETTDHLPVNRGFASHVGYLGGSETYSHGGGDPDPSVGEHDMWADEGPGLEAVREMQHSTDFYAQRASQIIKEHDFKSLFLYLGFQNTHAPFTLPPKWQVRYFPEYDDQVYPNMLAMLDEGVLNVTTALRGEAEMWESTLLLFFSDNGGVGTRGNNYPLRGHKHDPYDGGTRVLSFLSGGFLPVRGVAVGVVHVADWLPTFAGLAGVAVPDGVEGSDVWPMLTRNVTQPRLVVTTEVSAIIYADTRLLWKLITLAGQSGHSNANGTQTAGDTADCLASCQPDPPQPGHTDPLVNGPAYDEKGFSCPVCNSSLPCLFELRSDPSERHNRAKEHPEIVRFLKKAIDDANRRGSGVTGHLDNETLARDYIPIDTVKEWRGFKGPCYRRKGSMLVL